MILVRRGWVHNVSNKRSTSSARKLLDVYQSNKVSLGSWWERGVYMLSESITCLCAYLRLLLGGLSMISLSGLLKVL